MTSAIATMVSVRTSAGIPAAKRMEHNFSKRPHDSIVVWQLDVTPPVFGLAGETRVRTTNSMWRTLETFWADQPTFVELRKANVRLID